MSVEFITFRPTQLAVREVSPERSLGVVSNEGIQSFFICDARRGVLNQPNLVIDEREKFYIQHLDDHHTAIGTQTALVIVPRTTLLSTIRGGVYQITESRLTMSTDPRVDKRGIKPFGRIFDLLDDVLTETRPAELLIYRVDGKETSLFEEEQAEYDHDQYFPHRNFHVAAQDNSDLPDVIDVQNVVCLLHDPKSGAVHWARFIDLYSVCSIFPNAKLFFQFISDRRNPILHATIDDRTVGVVGTAVASSDEAPSLYNPIEVCWELK